LNRALCKVALARDHLRIHELALTGFREKGRGVVVFKFTLQAEGDRWLKEFDYIGYTALEELDEASQDEEFYRAVETYDPQSEAAVAYLCEPSKEQHHFLIRLRVQ
jgi:hypothetical protein